MGRCPRAATSASGSSARAVRMVGFGCLRQLEVAGQVHSLSFRCMERCCCLIKMGAQKTLVGQGASEVPGLLGLKVVRGSQRCR